MTTAESAPEAAELVGLLAQLCAKLNEWNQKYGHPFEGIEDGFRTAIRDDLMSNCRAFASREALIAALPKGKCFAEVGKHFGQFSAQIVELNQPREFHIFDWHLDVIKPEYRQVLDQHAAVFYHSGDPGVTVEDVPAGSFDVVYLNKAKDFAGTRRDLDVWFERLAAQGHLVVNDFTAWDPVQGIPYGVLPAVSQFVNERNLQVTHVALQARGFLNLAFRKGA